MKIDKEAHMATTASYNIDPDCPPNFTGSYPLGGELIGPAWRIAWAALASARRRGAAGWVLGDELTAAMRHTGVVDKTARGLLGNARRAGLLEVRYRVCGRPARRRAEYRVPAVAMTAPTVAYPIPFRAWLRRHRDADTPIGDLARDSLADRDWPRGPGSLRRYLAYLVAVGACNGAVVALEEAWGLYRAEVHGEAARRAVHGLTPGVSRPTDARSSEDPQQLTEWRST